ncbi:MAG: transposase [Spirochaetales bacterium]|nr:transposase [Spirochaetales bacterium]
MLLLIFELFKLIFSLMTSSFKNLLVENEVLKKENEILKRSMDLKGLKPHFTNQDRLFFALFSRLSSKINQFISLVKPETVMKWFHQLILKRWNYSYKRKPGRKPVSAEIRNLILRFKNESVMMGAGKIQGELLKLGFKVSLSTIRRVIQTFRKQGEVKRSLTWSKFIKAQIKSLFAADFFTVDTFLGKRIYVFFIIALESRKVVQFCITDVPNHRFVRNQLIGFMDEREDEKTFLIHDNSGELRWQNYEGLGIKDVPITPMSPNMNAFAERFIGSVRRECLNYFIIFNRKHLDYLLREYIDYYNSCRPHQGIEQKIPDGYKPQIKGRVVSSPVLSGLWNHYYREAA